MKKLILLILGIALYGCIDRDVDPPMHYTSYWIDNQTTDAQIKFTTFNDKVTTILPGEEKQIYPEYGRYPGPGMPYETPPPMTNDTYDWWEWYYQIWFDVDVITPDDTFTYIFVGEQYIDAGSHFYTLTLTDEVWAELLAENTEMKQTHWWGE